MTFKTKCNLGRRCSRSETLVRDSEAASLKAKTSVRAGDVPLTYQKVVIRYAS